MVARSLASFTDVVSITFFFYSAYKSFGFISRDFLTALLILAIRKRNAISTSIWLRLGKSPWTAFVAATVSCSVFGIWKVRDGYESGWSGGRKETKLKPLLFPCRTTHTRLFPTVHSFSYSYLYAGVPVGWYGPAGKLLAADVSTTENHPSSKSRPRSWFTVEAEDYLCRGTNENGLQGKLKEYLQSLHVAIEEYPYAYLVTAPRFLGFSFNPVSFWYLYTRDYYLAAMILEVNNTFDERRMYFLGRTNEKAKPGLQETTFKHQWNKDFHVSPFNARDGSYSLTATDPFAADGNRSNQVDCNIVLHSPEGKPKLVARVFSTETPVATLGATRMQTFLFILRWWWVGFMTNPRIVREARTLWSKSLQVFFRPEVLIGSIGRQATSDEIIIESFFSAYVESLAVCAAREIMYTSAAGPFNGKVQRFGPTASCEPSGMELQILTPAFYSELVHFLNISQAIKQLGILGEPSERMVHLLNIELWDDLFEVEQKSSITIEDGVRSGSLLWSVLKFCNRFNTSHGAADTVENLSGGRLGIRMSDLDNFVLDKFRDQAEVNTYETASTRILLSHWVAFGSPGLLRFYELMLWLFVCWCTSSTLGKVIAVVLDFIA